ncbi:flagellar basal body P-ring protein FlgI [Modicisalibacter tunisiensis]|uniref:Flagellar P-ring protein n=1 Tax=Modicisalibacter tunisiensis TaxID=390637 RepID=A0ABS7X1H7_9GAMM|nr:flagellar basal body P-ring protein FlgI [Modicisalibacter tunisiensis]MBZ9538320.1 flagellar basal body P-ring protein FlgI [Modicisalibacter tunisiensis]MBZ9568268.1 flagellar basal body P-ring protein FlgI [Modicisalibacter tunisiensis]
MKTQTLSSDVVRLWLWCLGILLACLLAMPARAERLQDLASFAGVRNNALVGYGLVVGLDGTGDQTTQAPFTTQSLTNMLNQLGISVPEGTNMQLKNVAAVMVTAELPPFARPGQPIDVVVSSVGNARSLRGGTLLMTPLKGANGQVYAMAQGNVFVGGAGAQAAGSSVSINQQAGGSINGGATVERAVPLALGRDGTLDLQLNEYSFDTAQRAVAAINREFGAPVAAAVDGRVIRLQAPADSNDRVRFMARVQNIDLALGQEPARVVINSRTGSVVLNSSVMLHQAAVAHGNLSVTISSNPQVSQPNAFSQGQTAVVPNANVSVSQEGGSLQMVQTSADLAKVVSALNALGATPQDLMSILQALKAAGSLRAKLEII